MPARHRIGILLTCRIECVVCAHTYALASVSLVILTSEKLSLAVHTRAPWTYGMPDLPDMRQRPRPGLLRARSWQLSRMLLHQ